MHSHTLADNLLSWRNLLFRERFVGATIHLFHMGFQDRGVVTGRHYHVPTKTLILEVSRIERKRHLTRDERQPLHASATFTVNTGTSILTGGNGVYRFTLPRADHGLIYLARSKAEQPI